jgi:hypothetical protein
VCSRRQITKILNTLLVGYDEIALWENFGEHINYRRWILSLSMRIGVSLMGLVATFFLIISEADPTELLLDFTAIGFGPFGTPVGRLFHCPRLPCYALTAPLTQIFVEEKDVGSVS